MPFKENSKVWMNGKLVNWADAKIHVASHALHYGSALFEGARCYSTPKGSAVFRLDTHIERLFGSCRIYRMDLPYTQDEFQAAVLETIRANEMQQCYIRPIVYRGYETLGVNPFPCPIECAILLWEWGRYLGPDALEKGVDARVSSWNRMAPNTFPSLAKSSANYMNAQLIKMEAIVDGYMEGIALDPFGHVSEGSGENVFLVRHGKIYTPPFTASILPGITRSSVMTIARDLGYEVLETDLPREMLYVADELFFAGTAVEVTPIRSVDRITIGRGTRGPVTEAIQRTFFGIINGEIEDQHGWLQYVYEAEQSLREAPKMSLVK